MKYFNILIISVIFLLYPFTASGQNTFETFENTSGEWDSSWKFYKVVKLYENKGLSRVNEPIDFEVDFSADEIDSPEKEIRVVEKDFRSGELIEVPSQVYNLPGEMSHVVFLANVLANSRKKYRIYFGNPEATRPNYESDLKVYGEVPQSIAENDYYTIDMTSGSSGSALNKCGQIRTITPKMGFNVMFSRRGGYVHYTPDCSRRIKSDGNIGVKFMNPPSKSYEIRGPLLYLVYREGVFTKDEPFVKFIVIYRFYSSVPYVISQANVELLQTTNLSSLRNDELTFNSKIFTHNARKELNGSVVTKPFPIERLIDGENFNDTDLSWPLRLPVNLPWLTFFNAERGYGIASLHLDYQASGSNKESGLTLNERQEIRIGKQSNYWSRILVSRGSVKAPKGTHYIEKNAYLVYGIDPEISQRFRTVEEYYTMLKNPLKIE